MPRPESHIKTQIPRLEVERIALVAKALAHPARLKIVAFLLSREECIAGDIVDEIGLAQSTVSEHLRILKAAGVISGAIEHPRICYSLDAGALVPLQTLLSQVAARAARGEAVCYTPGKTAASSTLHMSDLKD